MLTAYLDESYNHRSEKDPDQPLVFTVGCWLSTMEKWSRFGKQWKSELKHWGLEDFHMNRFENRKGVYEDWTDTQRHTFLRRLKQIIKQNTVYGVSVAVNCDDYDALLTPEIKSQWGTYYGFDVRVILWYLGQSANDQKYMGQIHYVFAHGPKQTGELDRIFTEILNSQPARERFRVSAAYKKASAKTEVRLQAADFIAYELNKRCVNEIRGGKRFVRTSLDMFALERERFAPLYMGKRQLIEMFDAYQGLSIRRPKSQHRSP